MLKVGRSLVGGLQGARGWESASEGKGGYFLERVQRGSCSSAEVSLWVCGSDGRGRAPRKMPAEHQTKANPTLRTLGKARETPNVSRIHSLFNLPQRTGAKSALFLTWPLDTHAPTQAKFSLSFSTSEVKPGVSVSLLI